MVKESSDKLGGIMVSIFVRGGRGVCTGGQDMTNFCSYFRVGYTLDNPPKHLTAYLTM
jgi:hypothetical protein